MARGGLHARRERDVNAEVLTRGTAASLGLPPLLLVLACLAGGAMAWRGARAGGLLAMLAALGLLLLATPFVSQALRASLEHGLQLGSAAPPAAIVVLGAEVVEGAAGAEIGPLTLERLRAAAALHRRTGLPVLVTAGVVASRTPPLAGLMAQSLAEDFGVKARWVEPRARNTRENAAFAAALLKEAGLGAAYVVSHGWHLRRALIGFAAEGIAATAAPVRLDPMPPGGLGDWIPRADHLAASWWALREWAGIAFHALRG